MVCWTNNQLHVTLARWLPHAHPHIGFKPTAIASAPKVCDPSRSGCRTGEHQSSFAKPTVNQRRSP
jgi:hypothetical protein